MRTEGKTHRPAPVAYFTNSSPDFINYKGQVISASDQVKALAQAQSIGETNISTSKHIIILKHFASVSLYLHHSVLQCKLNWLSGAGGSAHISLRCSRLRPSSPSHSASRSSETTGISRVSSVARASACSSSIRHLCMSCSAAQIPSLLSTG